jgi:hypothetical protein
MMLDDIYKVCVADCATVDAARRRFVDTCITMWSLGDEALLVEGSPPSLESGSFEATWMPLAEFCDMARFGTDGFRQWRRSGKPLPQLARVGRRVFVSRVEADKWFEEHRMRRQGGEGTVPAVD